ncbi:MAG: hypothetical protein ACFFD4_38940, partial [Candidatus Odinarchaeota archaeon]
MKDISRMKNIAVDLINSKNFVFFSLVFAFCIRFLWIILVNPTPISDFSDYYDKAINLSKGYGYQTQGKDTAYRSIGYPLFLAVVFTIFGSSVFIAKLSNVFLYNKIDGSITPL